MQSQERFKQAYLKPLTAKAPGVGPLGRHLDVPVDGFVELWYPARPEQPNDEYHTDIPFRDHRKTDEPWAVYPDEEWGSRHPVWKWKNPEASIENITLNPSYGQHTKDGEWKLHCWIREGEIDLL